MGKVNIIFFLFCKGRLGRFSGAARIFLRGWLKLWKQKVCKGKIACDKNSQESTYIVDKQLTVLTTKPGALPTKLPSCFSDILS